MTYREPAQAFHDAIAAGRLSDDPDSAEYAGHFMYMGTDNGRDLFKHADSREYLRK